QGDETTIVATTSGVISFNNAATTEGSAVKGGETIVTISSKNIADGDPAAKARIAFNTAQKEYDRAQELVKDQIISQKEFDAVKSNFETARLSYQALAKSQSAQGTRVTAPISGYLKSRLVNEGEFVSVGQPIAVISQNKQLQLRAEVPEKYYKELSTITSANFKTPYDNTVYELSKLDGRLVSFGKASGNNSFYIPVTFAFNNVGDIVPGSFVEVFLISSPIREALVVPLSALIEEQGVYYVFVQLDEEGYSKQEVTLGGDNGNEVQILSGLKPGEVVVTKGAMQVKLASMSSAIPHGHSH
ncbi:MAG: efflux RND transporter periplasmic adaptor subunit, partial [Tannerellaceae bacterium]